MYQSKKKKGNKNWDVGKKCQNLDNYWHSRSNVVLLPLVSSPYIFEVYKMATDFVYQATIN